MIEHPRSRRPLPRGSVRAKAARTDLYDYGERHGRSLLRASIVNLIVIFTLLALLAGPSAASAQGEPAPSAGSGWYVADLQIAPKQLIAGQVATVRFRVLNADKAPVDGLTAQVSLVSDAGEGGDLGNAPILTALADASDGANYVAHLALNLSGSWVLQVDAEGAGKESAHTSRHLTVGTSDTSTSLTSDDDPIFLPGDVLGNYYRLDPSTGGLALLSGQQALHAGKGWWLASTQLTPLGAVTSNYGGSWDLSVQLSNGLTGDDLPPIDLGSIRASVYPGSSDQPAIVTALAIGSNGSRIYLYWARQLGQGWLSYLAVADPASGKILRQRELIGAIIADVFYGRLSLSDDGSQLVLAEQAVRSSVETSSNGYRLTVFDPTTLATMAEHRNTVASNDPLTNCLLAYPGPSGTIGGNPSLHYSLCSPTSQTNDLALLIWNPMTGKVVKQLDLSSLVNGDPSAVYGGATDDGKTFYAVNTNSGHIAEVNLDQGKIVRDAGFGSGPSADANTSPSTWDRFRNWLTGLAGSTARAGVLLDPGVAVAPDGKTIYVAAPDSSGDPSNGVLVIDAQTLKVSAHLLAGDDVAGLTITPGGQLIVRQPGSDGQDEITVINPAGQAVVTVRLTGGVGNGPDGR